LAVDGIGVRRLKRCADETFYMDHNIKGLSVGHYKGLVTAIICNAEALEGSLTHSTDTAYDLWAYLSL
jgi:hypothetical protein